MLQSGNTVSVGALSAMMFWGINVLWWLHCSHRDTFEYLVDHEKVKPDLRKRDKYPNIDGDVEIVDEGRRPIAKLDVEFINKKERYSIDEIEKAFFQYLFFWVDESIRFMVKVQRNRVKSPADLLYRKPYFDPDMLLHQIMREERKQIDRIVRERIRQKKSIPRIPLGNDRFPFGIFAEFLSFLKSNGFEEIGRVYSPRDYSRLSGRGGWVWNVFSPDAVEKNLNVFFDNLPKVYDDVVLQNFPDINGKLPLFGDASLSIVLFSVKGEYKTFRDGPTIEFFHLKTENQDGLKIEIHRKEETKELPDLSWDYVGKDIEIKGKKHRLISGSRGVLDFIYDDLPMFNFLYKILEENLKRYFDSLRMHA